MALDPKYHPLVCFFAALALAVASHALVWPWLLLVAYAPLFALHAMGNRAPYFSPPWLSATAMLLAGLFAFACAKALGSPSHGGIRLDGVLGAVLVPYAAFVLHGATERYARNKLGWFSLAIFWVALEYQWLSLGFQRPPLLGDLPTMPEAALKWNRYTGLLGVSLWVLVANMAFYRAVFAPEGTLLKPWRWARLFGFLFVVCAPIAVAYPWLGGAVGYHWLATLYGQGQANLPDWLGFYAENGEYFGRTATWVSVLMLIFVFVKHKTR